MSESWENNEEYRDIWKLSGTYRFSEADGNDKAWAQMQDAMKATPVMKVSWFRRNYIAVAASLALIMIAGAGFWLKVQKDNANLSAAFSVITGINEFKTIELPDGSVIKMNSTSEIKVGEGFNETNRKILLKGQAKFEVAKNANLPFEIDAGATKTKVLGTGFDISAYEGEGVSIAVFHGKVEFRHSQKALIMTAGNRAVYNPVNGLQSVNANSGSDCSWEGGEWVFKRCELRDIAALFQHRYGKKLVYQETDAERQFTGKFPSSASAEDIVRTISQALNIRLSIGE